MRLKFINFNELFDPEMVISSSNYYDSRKNFDPKGLFSEEYFGKNEDDTPIDRMGWIQLNDIEIISPVFYKRLEKIFKPSILNKIISYNKISDNNGHIFDEPVKGTPIEFQNIGIPGFIEHFEEIMELYANTEVPEYNTIVDAYNNGILFTSILPVFSSKLRPGILYAGNQEAKPSFRYDDINNYYNIIIQYSNKISEALSIIDINSSYGKHMIYPLIGKVQDYANKCINFLIDNFLRGKKGIFRKIVAATRIGFSARNVLTPNPNLPMDSVQLPYLTFLELYRFPLINLMIRNEGITANQANDYLQNAKTHFDKKLYKYMCLLVEKGNLKILLNRNPSINIGSIICLNIHSVKANIHDLTLSVSNSILAPLNADYDGDVLNIAALLSEEQKYYFKNLAPSKLVINKNNGKFERGFSLAKDARTGYVILNS